MKPVFSITLLVNSFWPSLCLQRLEICVLLLTFSEVFDFMYSPSSCNSFALDSAYLVSHFLCVSCLSGNKNGTLFLHRKVEKKLTFWVFSKVV